MQREETRKIDLKGIYNNTEVMFSLSTGVSIQNLKGIYNSWTCFSIASRGVSTRNLKGIYNVNID
jgi:hypothetical protein